ncbi:MAG: molybdopterin-dependent oxidoreductase [Haloglomus sp.]
MVGPDTRGQGPAVDPEEWRLTVTGAVRRTLSLSRSDLAELPLETFTDDFDCVEGWVAEDCTWHGVRVSDLYRLADPTAANGHALVRALDGDYACSFPMDRLADAVLALELDGAPLTVEDGGPARLVPTGDDRDCWESVKWVDELRLCETDPARAATAKEQALSRLDG